MSHQFSTVEFCSGFFHIDESFEWKYEQQCLCPQVQLCPRMIVRGVVTVILSGEQTPVLTEAYTNVFNGATERNLHVEELMVADKELAAFLQPGSVLTLYITYQPCHHSAGGSKLGHKYHTKSCTLILLDWYVKVLQPKGISIRIKCCGIYRVHWENPAMFRSERDKRVFIDRVNEAQTGLKMLMGTTGIQVLEMTRGDWELLLEICEVDVRAAIGDSHWIMRERYDMRIGEFLKQLGGETG